MSRKDFCKCLGIAKKELNESRFWVRTTGRRRWLDPGSLTGLEQECLELKRILGAMIRKTRESDTR
jgi:four helix bundle protein